MLKFAPFSSNVEASFWIKLSDLKLHKLRLLEEATYVRARYGIDSKQQASMNSIARVRFDQDSFDLDAATTHNEEIDVMESIASSKRMNSIARVRFDQDSFNLDAATTHKEEIECRGKILVYNTMESLKKVNKNVVLRSFYDDMIEVCERGDILESAQSFLYLCYLDLKAHSVVYWFAFPALAASGHALEYDADQLRDTEGVDIEAFYQGFEQYRRAGIEGNVKPL